MKRLLILLIAGSTINTTYVLYTDEFNSTDTLVQLQNSIHVTATMYNPVTSQCDEDPLVTAGMFKINPHKASDHKWIAVSRNLLKRWGGPYEFGDKVKVMGAGHKDGIYTVVDTMNKRFKNRIDILETVGTKHYIFKNVQIASI